MILKISFSNIFSFKDEQEISFIPQPLKEFPEYLVKPHKYGDSEVLLRSIATYGHNSYGKSNILKALEYFLGAISNSFKNSTILTELDYFALNTTSRKKPSLFEVIFLIDDVKYRYGFKISQDRVHEEWLYYAPYGVKESYLFERNEQEFRISKQWNRASENKIESQATPFAIPNVLLSSVLIAQNNSAILSIFKPLNSILLIKDVTAPSLLAKSALIFSSPRYAIKVNQLLEGADLGFKTIFDKVEKRLAETNKYERGFLQNIFYEKEVEKFELYTYHRIYDDLLNEKEVIEFDFLKKESDGTIKFFIIASLLVYAIENNLAVFIDELDSKFHSDLLDLLISKFHSPIINTGGCQLFFTTHNTILLDKKLRRDQVYLVEKDEYGASNIKPMHTKSSPVRIDASIEKDYRKGKYGGVSKKIHKRFIDPNQRNLFD